MRNAKHSYKSNANRNIHYTLRIVIEQCSLTFNMMSFNEDNKSSQNTSLAIQRVIGIVDC